MDSNRIDVQAVWSDPAGLLPAQVGSSGSAPALERASLRLMRAVLQRAVQDYLELGSHAAGSPVSFAAVSSWFRSRDSDSPFSFNIICEALELDSEAVREAIARRLAEAIAVESATGESQSRSADRRPSVAQPSEPAGQVAA